MNFFEEKSEAEYISLCKAGDGESFKLLIDRYRNKLFGFLYKLLNDNSDAEDAFQETLMKVWTGIVKYDDREKFSSWLFTIAHNTAMDAMRKRKTKIFGIDQVNITELNTENSFRRIELKESVETVELMIDKLPGKQKRVFLLRYYGGISFKEIAGITEEPLNTVLGHMHYAVGKIKKVLKEENDYEYKKFN